MDIEAKVIEILKDSSIKEPILLTDNLKEDLGFDELEEVEIVMRLEEEFGIEIPDEDAEKLLTVEQIINYVKEKKAS